MSTLSSRIRALTERSRYLHKPDEKEADGPMVKAQLHRIGHAVEMLQDAVAHDDQLPAWVLHHITVAQENLEQVVGYLEPKHHSGEE